MTEVKNSIESFNSRLDQAEERISDLEDKSFEIVRGAKKKKKRNEGKPSELMGYH